LGLVRPHLGLVAASAAFRVGNQGLAVAVPALAAWMLGRAVTGDSLGLPRFLGALVILVVVKAVFRYLEQLTGHAVAFRLLAKLRVDAFGWIERLGPARLIEERSGDLVATVTDDVDAMEPLYAHTIPPLASATVVPLVAATIASIAVSPRLGALTLAAPLLLVLVIPWIGAVGGLRLAAAATAAEGEAAAATTDFVQGVAEIVAFDARVRMREGIEAASNEADRPRRAAGRASGLRSLLGGLIAALGTLGVAVVGFRSFEAGQVDFAGLMTLVVVAWVVTTPGRALEQIVPDTERALAASERLFALADREPGPQVKVSQSIPVDGSIQLRGVGVRLKEVGLPSLEHLDLDIEAGSFVAVVGPSGAGKSTMAELLVRVRDADVGQVRLGGADVAAIPPEVLRREVALVGQRPDLFFGSVADNLLLAAPDAEQGGLEVMLERVGLGQWVESSPSGIHTSVGEHGSAMSGGERQRLAIAQALLREPRVLILDEATSQLDMAGERDLLAEVRREGRTLVVVSHRLEPVTDADRIAVLSGGLLVESGSHEELLDLHGVYAGLWRRESDSLPSDEGVVEGAAVGRHTPSDDR
jgi:ABC-type transport system involved in cytochrome bd biosynthesis fused ATPase/permease subunit